MSLMFADGFGYNELNDILNWWDIRSDVLRTTNAEQSNNYAPNDYYCVINDNGAFDGFYKYIVPQKVLTLGCSFKTDDAADRSLLHFWTSDGTLHSSIIARYNSTIGKHYLSFEIWVGATYASNVYFDNRRTTWHYLEWQYRCDDTDGYSIVRLNGEEVIAVYGIDTNRSATVDTVGFIRVGGNTAINSNDNGYDDFYITSTGGIANTGFLGPLIVESVYPGGTGLTNDWVGSDGDSIDNHLLVDDESNTDDATYVEASGLGDTDLYKISSLSQSSREIKAVQVYQATKRVGLNPVSGVMLTARDGSIVSGQNYLAREGSYNLGLFNHLDIDPFTSLPWTYSGLDNFQIGHRVTHVS